jgi:predicted Zn-dependent peptidase
MMAPGVLRRATGLVALFVALTSALPVWAGMQPSRKWVLPNGMRVVFQENERTATVVMCGFVRVTALHEVRPGPGIRSLTNMCVGRAEGCEEIIRRAALRVDTAIAPDYVEIIVSAPAESVNECAEVLRRLLFSPQLTEAGLETERVLLLRRFAARGEVPTGVAMDLALDRTYPGSGGVARVSGDPLVVSQLTLDEVRRFHAAHYLPNATVISVSGGVRTEATRNLIAGVMGGLLPGGVPAQAPMSPSQVQEGRASVRWAGESGVVCVGARGVSLDSPDYPAAAVAIVLLSAGGGSRLFQALRVDRALAYTITGDITPSSVAPVVTVLVAADRAEVDEVERVIGAEIDRLVAQPPDLDELRRAKRYLIGQHALRHQRNEEIAHFLGVFEMLGGAPGYRLDTLLAGRFAAVGAAEVQRVASEMFERRTVVVLGEESDTPAERDANH